MKTMNRFDTPFGNDGQNDFRPPGYNLKPYSGLYRFQDRTWAITVWASNPQAAQTICAQLNLKYDGQIVDLIE